MAPSCRRLMTKATTGEDHMSQATSELTNRVGTRRDFLKRTGAASVALSVAGVGILTQPAAAAAMPAYRIDYTAEVLVAVGQGRRYDVTVTDRAGNLLEMLRKMNSAKLQRTQSQYFTVTGIMPPG